MNHLPDPEQEIEALIRYLKVAEIPLEPLYHVIRGIKSISIGSKAGRVTLFINKEDYKANIIEDVQITPKKPIDAGGK